jgi:gliding motility-associated-like protein
MKKQYFLLFFIILFICRSNNSFAQHIGTSTYLQGAYLEIGMCTNSAFGTTTPPAGYHAHCPNCWPAFSPVPPYGLAEVYDYGHDGWAVGAPPSMGDYTLPGSPFEGWEVQMNGVRAQQYASPAYAGAASTFSGAATMTAAGLTTYSNVGQRAIGNWQGNFGGGGSTLVIMQETRVDTFASAVVITTRFYNTSGTNATGVYYWRSCDPDNDETWPGGGFATHNVINFQDRTVPNPSHKVMVTATGYSATSPTLTLGTKDCRAVACIYDSWGLTVTQDLATAWGMMTPLGFGGAFYDIGVDHAGDIGIGLVYNLGTIAAGDSAIISYAYVFNGPNGINDDGALPDPAIFLAHDTVRAYPDTLNACDYPGIDSLPFNVIFGDDKDWSWSTWTWAPSTGLSSTTGVHNWIHLGRLPGGTITYTITGNDSGNHMNDCNHKVFLISVHSCHQATCNSPCEGDTLQFRMSGDSLGAVYAWRGPHGFTSTLHNPYFYPCTLADTGWYYVIKTTAGIHDTDSTHATIYPKPHTIASNNSPLCAGLVDTLTLRASLDIPGETFSWTGPGGYTSGLENPTIIGAAPPTVAPPPLIAIGVYTVVTTTTFGCKDTTFTRVDTISIPKLPEINGVTPYCQFETLVPFTVDSVDSGGIVLWYTTAVGGTATGVAPPVNMSVPGYTTIYASQKVGSCEGPRDTFTVRVITTPPAPIVTYNPQYCQFIGPVDTIIATHTATGTLRWYMAAVGGPFTLTQPTPNIRVDGVYNYWVSQIDSGCESPRTPITITIHRKPDPPTANFYSICQFHWEGPAVSGTLSEPGDTWQWYGPLVSPPGTATAPVPPVTAAPDTIVYYATETSSFGCVSDSGRFPAIIRLHPQPPVAADIKYCQRGNTVPLNGQVDSQSNSHLNWYYNAIPLHPPVYPLNENPIWDTTPGNYIYYVSQVVPNDSTGCESDSIPLTVTVIYKPVFDIAARPWVCQFDSIMLAYDPLGPKLFAPGYKWTLPEGAYFADHTHSYDSSVIIKFDSAILNNYVLLHVTDDSGFCFGDTSIRIKIVAQPVAYVYGKPDVCLGDTTALSLAYESGDAYSYIWYIDSLLMGNSPAINIVASNSNSGGPFSISWIDSGRHIIQITSFSKEGCKSEAWKDTINVHVIPDATFRFSPKNNGTLCLEDSILFVANTQNYNNSYDWSPSHSFNNENTPKIWGKVEQLKATVTLTVTDPFGCVATESREIDPEPCCIIAFPNAFTPNGDKINNLFRPICSGYHRFHMFRVVNRWGQTVYETSNSQDAAWDGNYNGVPQDIGTYYYYLKYDCGGNTLEQKGDVTLLR